MINLQHLVQKKLVAIDSLSQIPKVKIEQNLFLSIDTRKIDDANLFLAMKGEKFNSFEFIKNLKGTSIDFIFYENNPENKILREKYQNDEDLQKAFYFIPISSDVNFLQQFAHEYGQAWRKLSNEHFVIGISGSNGKTSNKDILNHLISAILPEQVVATLKNDNNHIGVPLTILRLREKSKILICELGSNHPGEMKVLLDILKPDIGLTTNIGQTHLEFFPSLNDVFLEEALIYQYVAKGDLGKRCFYLNDQDEFLRKLSLNSWVVPFSSFSIKPEDNSVSLKWQEKIIQVKNEWIWGKHNFLNLGVCLVMALELAEKFQLTELAGGHFEKILLKAASEFKFQNLRSEWRDHQGKKYFVDAYNANPSSMKASINSFASFIKLHHHQTQDALFIIGDMRELGDQTQNCHEDLGNYLNELLPQFNNNLNLVYVGEFGSYVRTTFHGDIKVYPNVLECSKDWNKIISDKKLIFLKASRAIKLENLINLS